MNEPDEDATSVPSTSRVQHFEDVALCVLVGLLVVLSCASILLRNGFGITFLWLDPMSRHLVLWSSFLGALVATREAQHIRIDAILHLLSDKGRRRATALSEALSAGICAFLAFIALRFVADERQYGGEVFLDLPQWWMHVIFPFVFGAMALRFAAAAWRRWT